MGKWAEEVVAEIIKADDMESLTFETPEIIIDKTRAPMTVVEVME